MVGVSVNAHIDLTNLSAALQLGILPRFEPFVVLLCSAILLFAFSHA
jgi:hypothetical protein